MEALTVLTLKRRALCFQQPALVAANAREAYGLGRRHLLLLVSVLNLDRPVLERHRLLWALIFVGHFHCFVAIKLSTLAITDGLSVVDRKLSVEGRDGVSDPADILARSGHFAARAADKIR